MQIRPHPKPLASFPTERLASEAPCPVRISESAESLRLCEGRRLNFMSYLCSIHEMGACGFEKLLFLHGGIDDFILVGGWDCGFKTNRF